MNDIWLAGYWGLLAGAALLLGAAVGYFARAPRWLTAAVMAFGSGVLLSALSFELILEAVRRGGIIAAAGGFFLGALIYTGPMGSWPGPGPNIASAPENFTPKPITQALPLSPPCNAGIWLPQ